MPRPALSPDLRSILSAVAILSESRYEIAGDPREVGEEASDGRPASLVEVLERDIYHRLFTRREDVAHRPGAVDRRREHLARLSTANCGKGSWDPGWRVTGIEAEGDIEVEKYGVRFYASPDAVRSGAGVAACGKSCRVWVPPERQELVTGFYMAYGEAELATPESIPMLIRLYWHLQPDAAVPLVASLTRSLNHRGIPFRLKVLSDPGHYRRADAGVLYLEPDGMGLARAEIVQAYAAVRDRLRETTPQLTGRLAPGLGVAEGAADGSSFGEHRCHLIADSLVRAFAAGDCSLRARSEAVEAAFRAAGIDPARPHLAPGSDSEYPQLEVVEGAGRRRERATAASGRKARTWAEAASRLGDTLCREAWWHEERCNWVGHVTGERRRPTMTALSADLYAGSAGVGLFLAHLYAVSGEADHRRTALGALRRSLAALRDEGQVYRPLAFFSGQLGVAWAAQSAAALVDSDELASAAHTLLSDLVARPDAGEFLDVLTGNAGAILWLLALRDTGGAALLDAAVRLGEEIEQAAVGDAAIRSWDNQRASGMYAEDPPLTGFSHGAAGIGLALFELFAATGRRSFLEVARSAFAYEESLFDEGRGNWPDLRDTAQRSGRPTSMAAWCHGAPGIVLARLRAKTIDSDRAEAYERAARRGLAITLRALEDSLREKNADATLCHGLCGLIEVASVAAEVLGEASYRRAAEGAMRSLVALHSETGRWPSGVESRARNPSLFLGEAGVGYTLLRLHQPCRVPSVLLPGANTREQLAA